MNTDTTRPSAPTVLERIADPLPGGRAQLVETLFADGETVYSVKRGSPAPMATVRRHAETLTFTATGVTRKRGA